MYCLNLDLRLNYRTDMVRYDNRIATITSAYTVSNIRSLVKCSCSALLATPSGTKRTNMAGELGKWLKNVLAIILLNHSSRFKLDCYIHGIRISFGPHQLVRQYIRMSK